MNPDAYSKELREQRLKPDYSKAINKGLRNRKNLLAMAQVNSKLNTRWERLITQSKKNKCEFEDACQLQLLKIYWLDDDLISKTRE